MAGKAAFRNPVAVSDLAAAVLDPVVRKRSGLSIGLIQSWEEIVGPRIALRSRPEKLQWPRRISDDEPFKPAVLVVACDAAAALHLQHESGEVIARVNAFLGFNAVQRLRIVQKPVVTAQPAKPSRPRALTRDESARIARTVGEIEDDGLRDALARLGASVVGTRRR